MSLLERFIEPTKNYINLKGLLTELSGKNNKPLYEIVSYLLCCDLSELGLYYIDSKYKITPIKPDDKNITNQTLEAIKEIIRLGGINDEHWVYADDDSLELFSDDVGDELAELIESQVNFYFNKDELSNFELLKDLLSFEENNDKLLLNNNNRIIEMQERIDELLDELADKEDSIKALLSRTSKNRSNNELGNKVTNDKIADLESQLAQVKTELANSQTEKKESSNCEIYNTKQRAIEQFNKSLAAVLMELDYRKKLRKGDIVNFIIPYMKELAFLLADEDREKADNLTVTYKTIYDNHLKGLEFKKGTQSNEDREKSNVELLFKKQLPSTE